MKKDFRGIKKNHRFLCLLSATLSLMQAVYAADPIPAATNPLPTNGGPTNIGQIPTPGTILPPDLDGATGLSVPAPAKQIQSLGRFHNKDGTVKISAMFLDRYKDSVVRVRVLDQAGNEIGKAMGVSVGRSPQYIATPLSLILGNSLQWADQIEISHAQGNKYFAKVALIDEQLDLVLLAPENHPAAIPFARSQDERAQVSVFTISFEDSANEEEKIKPTIHKAFLAAVNAEMGTLSISGKTLTNEQAGTGIINMNGELVGMMLPSGKGVLASMLVEKIEQAKKSIPLAPNMVGVVMGRGVLVQKNNPSAYPTISEALKAIKEGRAPKSDTKRFIPAKDRSLSPKEAERVVLKVLPGTYRESSTLEIPSEISFTGSGAKETVIVGTNPKIPVMRLKNANNCAVVNFRIVPAPLQEVDAPTIEVKNGNSIRFIGNLIEAKGGMGLLIDQTINSAVFANVFPMGKMKALSCKNSSLVVEGNAFLGEWEYAMQVDKGCAANIVQNLFLETKNAISISSLAGESNIANNTILKSLVALRITGSSKTLTVKDNLLYENSYNFYSLQEIAPKNIGRNAAWKGKILAKGNSEQSIKFSNLVQTKPLFVNPDLYDFRIKPGTPQLMLPSLDGSEVLYYGAFQNKNKEMMGRFTPNLAHVLEAATGQKGLAEAWGY